LNGPVNVHGLIVVLSARYRNLPIYKGIPFDSYRVKR